MCGRHQRGADKTAAEGKVREPMSQAVYAIRIRREAAVHSNGCLAGWPPNAFGLVLLHHSASPLLSDKGTDMEVNNGKVNQTILLCFD